MFDVVRPTEPNADAYAGAEDLTLVDDLLEQDVIIRGWKRNGQDLKLRVKALSLEQQDKINTGALKQNPKTKEWEIHDPTFCALTLLYGVITPGMTPAQSQEMPKKNPVVIKALANFIWALAALDSETLEATAHALAPPDPNAAPGDAPGDDPGADG